MMSVCVWDKCSCTSGVSFDAENLITLTADRTSIPAVLASPFCPLSPGRPFSIKSSATQSPGSCPAAIQVQWQSQSSAAVREGIEREGGRMKKDIQINTTFVQQISTPRGCEVDMGQEQRWTEGMLNWS